MSPQPQTYTPAQYLEAGYRAEMAGDHERAAQYYRYLADVFADTPEGEAAAAGLMRISTPPPRQPAPSPASHHPHQQSSAHQPQSGPPPATRPASADRTASPRIRLGELAHHDLTTQRPGGAQPQQPQRQPARQPSPQSQTSADTASVRDGDDAMRLPEVVARRARELAELDEQIQFEPRYRGARLIAHLLTWLGWIAVAAGLALAVLGAIGISVGVAGTMLGLPAAVVVGVIVMVAGFAMALGGQVALATFDQAQSLREIGVILRARTDL